QVRQASPQVVESAPGVAVGPERLGKPDALGRAVVPQNEQGEQIFSLARAKARERSAVDARLERAQQPDVQRRRSGNIMWLLHTPLHRMAGIRIVATAHLCFALQDSC